MRVCDLTTGLGRLQRSMAKLKEAWAETQETWNDKASHEFSEKFLKPMPAQFTQAAAVIHSLFEVLSEGEKALEDRRNEDF